MKRTCTSPDCQTPARARGLCKRHYNKLRCRVVVGRRGHKSKSIKERLEAQYIPEPNSGCWIWLGAVCDHGRRGAIFIDKKRVTVARVSYALFRGPIPQGLNVCHSCDEPLCVNPDHLWLGTRSDNMQDMHRKGRARRPQNRVGRGVSRNQRGGWRAYVYSNGKQIHIGSFATSEEALAARAAYAAA